MTAQDQLLVGSLAAGAVRGGLGGLAGFFFHLSWETLLGAAASIDFMPRKEENSRVLGFLFLFLCILVCDIFSNAADFILEYFFADINKFRPQFERREHI